ncbi:unnamed protein product [Somion occarium]|uniref:Uncharacterized protein n=1 Tax=Somion occarium TaxID=3059160 RepID=A0ABP1E123_9APHY
MAHLEQIAANAISTAVLAVAGVYNGSVHDLQFSRTNSSPPPPFIKKESFQYTPIIGPDAPPRLESNLPPPGSLSARLILGQRIDAGAVGTVFEAEIDYGNSSPELKDSLPPLVVKISLPLKSKRLNWEAACYEEMEPLSEVVVPRYYGFFQLEVPPDMDLKYGTAKRGPVLVGRSLRAIAREDLLDMYSDLSRFSVLHEAFDIPISFAG